jgi:hypothetical protein
MNIWTPLASVELYNGTSDTFISLGATMSTARFYHTATYVSPSVHQVLITGGNPYNAALNTMSVFDIIILSFISLTESMSSARMWHTATLLSTGKVLLVGGSNGNTSLSTCELIDPTNNNYSSTLSASLYIGRYYHTATFISSDENDTVLVCGGYNTDIGALNSCELYFV